ncbi:uncharacterized protein EI97DRAFT_431682 [Westerdykella ornata]|uniref:Uncharacterized protein n=1 Tax=Westerdykella ornata TaxID=318751 RepID=A0A6A6JQE1_WESOR|nr:uncharacterized protein EI97DRAFT_431682 [Westerdykella ornata]KAF2278464.1 hypothetical protein EI97DRAFT_431682 [Westerdykella ornata]
MSMDMDGDGPSSHHNPFDMRPSMEPALPIIPESPNPSPPWKSGVADARMQSQIMNGNGGGLTPRPHPLFPANGGNQPTLKTTNGVMTSTPRNEEDSFTSTNGTHGTTLDDDPYAWMESPEKIARLRDLKNFALGNARLLYGNDRNRYHDIVTAYIPVSTSDSTTPGFSNGGVGSSGLGTWVAILIITIDGTSKALREERSECPIRATQALVRGLMRDTGVLFCGLPLLLLLLLLPSSLPHSSQITV